MPEDAVPETERLSFLAGYIEGAAPVRERRWALNRALRLAAQRDRETLVAWRARETAFYRSEAARIDVAVLPSPAMPCDFRPDAESNLPACGPRTIDYETGNLFEIVAEAARIDGDFACEIQLREASAIFMGGANPHITYWTNLASRAADAGQDDAARRVCSYLRATQYRLQGPDPFVREKDCLAYAALRARRWGDWLALCREAFVATTPDNPEALLSYCVAFAHTGARSETGAACDSASQALTAHGARLAQAAASPDSNGLALQIRGGARGSYDGVVDRIGDEVALRESRAGARISMAAVVADLWATERPLFDAVIAACRRVADSGDADDACDVPDSPLTLNVTFTSRAEALSGLVRALGGSTTTNSPQRN